MIRTLFSLLLACGLTIGCTGKGEPTTPSKVVTYTENNIRNSANDAPNAARRAGKRITPAVDNVTGETANGNDPEDAAPADKPAE
jgi:hypothetical protein